MKIQDRTTHWLAMTSLVILLASAGPLSAAYVYWDETGAGPYNWSSASHWDPGLPGASDTAVFPNPPVGSPYATNINLDTSPTLAGLTTDWGVNLESTGGRRTVNVGGLSEMTWWWVNLRDLDWTTGDLTIRGRDAYNDIGANLVLYNSTMTVQDDLVIESTTLYAYAAGVLSLGDDTSELTVADRTSIKRRSYLFCDAGATAQLTDCYVGGDSYSPGHLYVRGAGSRLTCTSDLYVGGQSVGTPGPGDVNIETGGRLDVDGMLTIWSDGTVNLDDGQLSADTINHTDGGQFNFDGGELDVATFNGDLQTNGGALSPAFGKAAGTVINGNWNHASGKLAVTLDLAVHDSVLVTGGVLLNADLEVTLGKFYKPSASDTFVILDAGVLAGVFANADPYVRVTNGSRFLVEYNVKDDQVILKHYGIPVTFYVDATAAPGGSGLSWPDAFQNLPDALAVVLPGDSIRVASGTYYPHASDRAVSFEMVSGVAVYGGFPVGGGTWSQRDPAAYPTVLSGNVGDSGVAGDNSYHVVEAIDAASDTILDGFAIRDGFANGSFPDNEGSNIFISGGAPIIRRCIIENGFAGDGGGIYVGDATPEINACIFRDNFAVWGAGLYVHDGGDVTAVNCLFTGNYGYYGGAMATWNGAAAIINSTFANNQADHYGGGLNAVAEVSEVSTVLIDNAIFWGNTCPNGSQIATAGSGATVSVAYSDVAGGAAGVDVSSSATLNWDSATCLDDDPLFVDALGGDGTAGTPDDNLRLWNDSPCINAGRNATVPAGVETDLDGAPRISDGTVDMGAYEYAPIYVDDTAGGANNGTTWTDAFTDLQDALAAAAPGNEIWVAAGTYRPAPPGGDVGVSFAMQSGVALYGGFPDGGGDWASRDPAGHLCALSGDLNGDDDGWSYRSDNSLHVLTAHGVDRSAILDGFTVSGGSATPNYHPANKAGGLYCSAGSPTVRACRFIGNQALGHRGGAIFNHSGSAPLIVDCHFEGNRGGTGGAICNENGCAAIIVNCDFVANQGRNNAYETGQAGAIYDLSSTSFVANCRFLGNDSQDDAGAVRLHASATIMVNCLFAGNTCSDKGGALFITGGASPTLVNCTSCANQANYGGAAYLSGSVAEFANCILYDDQAATGPELACYSSSTVDVSYSNVADGAAGVAHDGTGTVNWGAGNLDAAPLFVDADGPDATAGTIDDNYRLLGASPGIDLGDNSALPADTGDMDGDGNTAETSPLDLAGLARVRQGDGVGSVLVDMGAYEKGIWYVDDTAGGADNGQSWADAFNALSSAIAAAAPGEDIWVAAGVYTPGDNRSASFMMHSQVGWYGGFVDGGSAFVSRDPTANVTLLSGDIGLANEYADNSYHVVQAVGVDATAVLDGFSIRSGNANGGIPRGGGLYCDTGAATITRCRFEVNHAIYGGAIGCYYGSDCNISDTVFESNQAQNWGGAVRIYQSNLTFERCTFRANTAGDSGGGVFCHESAPTVNNCLFDDNHAAYGGGFYDYIGSGSHLDCCTFYDNGATYAGGGLRAYGSYTEDTVVMNSIFWENAAPAGPDIALSAATLQVGYCDLMGGVGGIDLASSSGIVWQMGNITADPCFADAAGGDFHLKSEGWRWEVDDWTWDGVTSRCIDAGNPGAPLGAEIATADQWSENLRINLGRYGRTDHASRGPHFWCALGDLNNDGIVNLPDCALQWAYWLQTAVEQPGDLNRDQTVDVGDLGAMTADWLTTTSWFGP